MENTDIELVSNISIVPTGRNGVMGLSYEAHYVVTDENDEFVRRFVEVESSMVTSVDMLNMINDPTYHKDLRAYINNWILSSPKEIDNYSSLTLITNKAHG